MLYKALLGREVLASKALAGAAMAVTRDRVIRADAMMVFMEILRGLEADVVGLAPLMTRRGCNSFDDVTDS